MKMDLSREDRAMQSSPLRLSVLEERLAVCRLEPGSEFPAWTGATGFSSVTRTADELSVVCPERNVPDGVTCEKGWRALKVEGPLDLSLVGVLASIAAPLAGAGVSVFAVSTHDTDYVLVREPALDLAVSTLAEQGHVVEMPQEKSTS